MVGNAPRGHRFAETKESTMRVSPYYSINPTDPDVHHDHNDCPTGKQIPARNRRSGTNDWRLCKNCREM
jgi:hypothetical protein